MHKFNLSYVLKSHVFLFLFSLLTYSNLVYAVQDNCKDCNVGMRKANDYDDRGKYQEAIVVLKEIIKNCPQCNEAKRLFANVNTAEGLVLFHNRKWALAIEKFEIVLKYKPFDVKVNKYLTDAKFEKNKHVAKVNIYGGDFNAASEQLNKASKLKTDIEVQALKKFISKYHEGEKLYYDEKYGLALSSINEALDTIDGNTKALELESKIKKEIQNNKLIADREFEQYKYEAKVNIKEGDFNAASEQLEKAFELKKDSDNQKSDNVHKNADDITLENKKISFSLLLLGLGIAFSIFIFSILRKLLGILEINKHINPIIDSYINDFKISKKERKQLKDDILKKLRKGRFMANYVA